MKAEKVIGIAACAFACVTSSAFANTTDGWFGVTVTSDTVNTSNISTNGVGVAQDGKLVLEDVDSSAPLTFTPSGAPARNDGVFVIQAAAELTPNSASDLDSAVTGGAKAGFAVGVDNDLTNFYGYANGAWTKLTGASVPALGANTNFKLVMNYRDNKIQFFVGDTLLASNSTEVTEFVLASGNDAPVGIDAYGTGSITSVTGEYEVAVAAYDNKKYGSVAEAVDVAGVNKAAVLPVSESGETPTGGTTAANDLPRIVCAVLNLDPSDKDAQAKAVPVANDADPDNVTLQVHVTEADVVGFEVRDNNGDLLHTYDASAIKIPTGTGVYTVTPVLK